MTTVDDLRKFLELIHGGAKIEFVTPNKCMGIELVYDVLANKLLVRTAFKQQAFLIPNTRDGIERI